MVWCSVRSRRRPTDSFGAVMADRPSAQHFAYEDGYITCIANRELVLGVQEQQDGGPALAVIVDRRRPDDMYQRWIVTSFG